MSKAWGVLEKVIDGDTVVMRFTSVSRNNKYEIGRMERVRLRRRFAPELGEAGSSAAIRALKRRLSGKRVEARLFARDCFGRLVGELEPATPFYGRA